jgi:hypothetical protein
LEENKRSIEILTPSQTSQGLQTQQTRLEGVLTGQVPAGVLKKPKDCWHRWKQFQDRSHAANPPRSGATKNRDAGWDQVPKDIKSFSQGQRPMACQGLGSVAGRKRLITCFASELSLSATQWCDERLEALMLRTQQHTGQSYLGRPRSGATNYQRQNRGTHFISILVRNSGRFYAMYPSRYQLFS